MEANPAVTEYQRELAASHGTIGYLLGETGKPAEALDSLGAALAIQQRLAEANPKITDYRRELVRSNNNIADQLRKARRFSEASAGYTRALAIGEPLVRENPQNTHYQTGPAYSLRGRGVARLDLGDSAGATADTRRAVAIWDQLPARNGEQWFEIACCHATLSALSHREDSGIPAPGRRGRGRPSLGPAQESNRHGLPQP